MDETIAQDREDWQPEDGYDEDEYREDPANSYDRWFA